MVGVTFSRPVSKAAERPSHIRAWLHLTEDSEKLLKRSFDGAYQGGGRQ